VTQRLLRLMAFAFAIALFPHLASAQAFEEVARLVTNPDQPNGRLLRATDGAFYGVTNSGGRYGLGTIYRITPGGTFTVVHSFDGAGGSRPIAGLMQASDGLIYGTTSQGGDIAGVGGGGTVFRIDLNGNFEVAYRFGIPPETAFFVTAGVAEGSDGFLLAAWSTVNTGPQSSS
jgi:uncharacterized repeat protein (TIGR03803 family)